MFIRSYATKSKLNNNQISEEENILTLDNKNFIGPLQELNVIPSNN